MRSIRGLAFASVSLLSLSAPAFAQDADADKEGDDPIVVTGTLIRGTEATGSQTLSVDPAAIKQIAATSTNELLASIPQLGNFNTRPEGDPRGLTAVSTIVRPNLRDFPSTNSTSGALTLILMDGLRITPVGSNASSPDPDIIPANILAGLDIVTDGGSSLYGADAVSGVMNFRTLRKFEGIKVDGNYGFGDTIRGFKTWDASVMLGHSWSTGNAYVSVSRAERDSILGRDTKWWNGVQYTSTLTPKTVSTQCNAPQATATRFVYIPSFGVWTSNPLAGGGAVSFGSGCDQTVDQAYLPGLKRTNVYGAITNEFSDTIDLRVTGYWMKRDISLPQYALGYTSKAAAAVAPSGAPGSPGAPASSPFDFPQGVGFTLGPNANYANTPQTIGIETWGVTPELAAKLSGDWAVRVSSHYGRSHNYMNVPQLNSTKMDTYIAGGQIVPTNIAAASSTVIADVTNFVNRQETNHEMLMFRAVADGSVFELPGGNAKLAVGAEYDHNVDGTRIKQDVVGAINSLAYTKATSNVWSVFGELHLPVTSFADVTGSVRHDHYNTFGGTTNPNVGVTLKPTSWLKVFGHWGTSYNAPTAFDKLGIGLGRAGVNYSTTVRPNVATGKSDNGQGTYFIVLTGASPAGLKPQTSKAWAVGFDATPFEGFNFGANFYSIDLKNALGTVNPANSATYLTNPSAYIYNNELTANGNALFNQIMGQLANGAAIQTQVGSAANVAILVDTRISNINSAKVEGVDMHLNYETDVSFGKLSFTNTAIVRTKALQTNSGSTTNELGHGQPRFTWVSGFGIRSGGFSSKITLNYSGVYRDNNTSVGGVEQVINPFVVTNLALGYDFAESDSVLKGLSLRANVDNLFGVEPQRVIRPVSSNGLSYVNWTLGRVFKLGATFKY